MTDFIKVKRGKYHSIRYTEEANFTRLAGLTDCDMWFTDEEYEARVKQKQAPVNERCKICEKKRGQG